VALLPPVAVPDKPGERLVARPGPKAPAGSLSAAIDRLRRSQPRYQAILVQLRGDTVVLQGSDDAGEDLMAFARIVRKIDGVKRVVIHDD
jgi:hypothetical protein